MTPTLVSLHPSLLCFFAAQVNSWARTKEHKFKVGFGSHKLEARFLCTTAIGVASFPAKGRPEAVHCLCVCVPKLLRPPSSPPPFLHACAQVTAIMVTHAVEYSGHGDFTDTVLLDSISPGHAEEKPQQGEQVG